MGHKSASIDLNRKLEYNSSMSKISSSKWSNLNKLKPQEYVCGFCGHQVASDSGYFHSEFAWIYICPNCGKPTYLRGSEVIPGPLLGKEIEGLDEDLETVYKELRSTLKNGDYTATQLLGRKLIMHLAVNVAGSKEKKKFIEYVVELKKSGYIPPNANKWVEKLKDLGNQKNHELKLGDKITAEEIIKFVEILLTFMYEYKDEEENRS